MNTFNPANPYVGPRSIEAGEAFFGREREVRSLTALLVAERIVLMHSPSGAGKTSLVQAGLLPNLAERFAILPVIRVNLEPPDELRELPGLNRYTLSTLLSLEESRPENARLPLRELAQMSLGDYLNRRPRDENSPQHDLLVFDQFEEILTASPTDRASKEVFFEQLGEALQNRQRWVLFVIREDYMGGLAPFARQIPNRLGVTFRLELLTTEAARGAIQKPAAAQNVRFDDSTVEILVNDLRRVQIQQPDGSFVSEQGLYIEPVQLQVVCYNLWQSGAAEDGQISPDDLQRIGSVDQALSSYYAESVKKVSAACEIEERLVRQWIGKHLITSTGIRNQALKGAENTEGLPNIVLQQLESAHLVRGESRSGKTWYELAHDRLVQPIVQDNAAWFESNLSLLQRQAVLWVQQGRSDGLLLRGKLLEETERGLAKASLTEDEQSFLQASQKLYRQQRLMRSIMFGLTGLFVVALAALVFSFWAYNQAEARRVTAIGQAALAEGDPNKAGIIAVQADQMADIEEAQDLLFDVSLALEEIGKIQSFEGLSSSVHDVAWSNDGRLAATVWEAVVWDANTRDIIQRIDNCENSLDWSEDGFLACPSAENTVIVIDPNTWEVIQTLDGNTDYVTQVAWSKDGHLATGSSQEILVWDWKTAQILQSFQGEPENPNILEWSEDGLLAAGYYEAAKIHIWDTNIGELVNTLDGNISAWSNDGQLAFVNAGWNLHLWNVATGQVSDTILLGFSDSISSLDWSEDGLVAAGSYDGTLVIWDPKESRIIQRLPGFSTAVTSVAWSKDGILASGGFNGTIFTWDLRGEAPIQTYTGYLEYYNDVGWSANGQVASIAEDKSSILILDAQTGEVHQTLSSTSRALLSLDWSDDGRKMAAGDSNNRVMVWDVDTGSIVFEKQFPPGNSFDVIQVAWSTDGRLAAGQPDGVHVLDGKSGDELQYYEGLVSSLAWSIDGLLSIGLTDDRVIIWDPSSGEEVTSLHTGTGAAGSLAWSDNGLLAAGTGIDTLAAGLAGTGYNVDKLVVIWDPENDRVLQKLRGYSENPKSGEFWNTVNSVAWSPDGRLASGADDGVLTIWDVNTGEAAQTLPLHDDSIGGVAWSPDGRLASVANDGTLKILSADFTREPCDWLLRNLSLEEWKEIIGRRVYDPACRDLPYENVPAFDIDYGSDFYIYTQPGRIALITLFLVGLATLSLIAWLGSKIIAKFFRTKKG